MAGTHFRSPFFAGENDKIVITAGPLAHFTGTIKKVNRHKKTARITTRLLGRDIDITVGLEIVSKK